MPCLSRGGALARRGMECTQHGPFATTPMGGETIPASMCTATATQRRGYQWEPCAGGGLRRQCGSPALHRAVRWRVWSPHRVAVVGQPPSQEAPLPLSMTPRTGLRSISPRRGTGLYLCRLFLLRSEWPKRSPLRQRGGYTHVLVHITGRLLRGFTSCSLSQHQASTLCIRLVRNIMASGKTNGGDWPSAAVLLAAQAAAPPRLPFAWTLFQKWLRVRMKTNTHQKESGHRSPPPVPRASCVREEVLMAMMRPVLLSGTPLEGRSWWGKRRCQHAPPPRLTDSPRALHVGGDGSSISVIYLMDLTPEEAISCSTTFQHRNVVV